MKYVVLGDGRKIGLGAYVKAWKACLTVPAKTSIGKGVSGWGETAGEALEALRKGMADRINRHIPGYGKGRKWSYDWQKTMWQTGWRINYPRLVLERCDIDWLPEAVQVRLTHRLRGAE